MDDQKKRRVFHTKAIRVDTRHAYQFIASNRGIWKYFPKLGQTAGKNMFFMLNFIIDRCSAETPSGKTTTKKDVSQAHWHSYASIAEELGVDKRAVIASMEALEDGGVIVRKIIGKLRFFAFSERAIRAMRVFSEIESAREDDEYKMTFHLLRADYYALSDRCDGRHWQVRRSSLTGVTVVIDRCDGCISPYIEERKKESLKKENSKNKDGSLGEPANKVKTADAPKENSHSIGVVNSHTMAKVEEALAHPIDKQQNHAISYELTEKFMERKLIEHGPDEILAWVEFLPKMEYGETRLDRLGWIKRLQMSWSMFERWKAEPLTLDSWKREFARLREEAKLRVPESQTLDNLSM